MNKPKASVDVAPLVDINDPSDLIGRTQLLMDLVPLVVQTDSSRVITVMVQDHAVVPKVEGVSADHHNLSHHGQDPTKIGQLEKIEAGIVVVGVGAHRVLQFFQRTFGVAFGQRIERVGFFLGGCL